MSKCGKLALTLILVFVSLNIFSREIIIVSDNSVDEYPISESVYIFEEKKPISIEQLIIYDYDKFFKLNNSSIINFGFTESKYWIKFSIINKTKNIKNLIFALDYPILRSVEFYEIKGTKLNKKIITGENKKFNTRDIKDRTFLFDLNLEPNIVYTYFVRVDSEGNTLRLPMSISTYKSYMKTDNYSIIAYGILIGLLFLSIIFNAFLAFITKDITNLYYAIYVAFLAFFLINITGLNYQFLWPDCPLWQTFSTTFFAAAANVFLLLFTSSFFYFTKNNKKVNKYFKVISVLLVVSILLTVFNVTNSIGVLFINILSLITIFSILTVSVIGLIKGNKLAIYFLFSFTVLVVGTTIYVFRNLGIIDSNILAQIGLTVGFLIEIILLMFAVLHRYRQIEKRNNDILEELVKERTQKLISKNEEIRTQRDEIENKHNEVVSQKDTISKKNIEIRDSMQYARIIQDSVLTPEKMLISSLKHYFIVNKPKELLGGDFYWAHKNNDNFYIAIADCTGHGVPGAMMSMLGISALNEIIREDSNQKPSEILRKLSVNIKNSLHQDGKDGESKDGMDISILLLNKNTKKLTYAGANNPIYIIRQDPFEDNNIENSVLYNFEKTNLLEIKADKLFIGYNYKKDTVFNDVEISLKTDDMIYMFSDGYADQFGGKNGRKYKYKNFRKLLACNALIKNKEEQSNNIINELQEWKGNVEQIDDIIVFGYRVK